MLVSPLGLDTPSKAGEERGLADQVDRQTCRQAGSLLHDETNTNSNRLLSVMVCRLGAMRLLLVGRVLSQRLTAPIIDLTSTER